MNKDYWRLKKREQRAKRAGEIVVIRPIPGDVKSQVVAEWDADKYPVRKAWEIAVERSERARRYAAMFPQFIRESDMKYQDIGWQYEHEGIPASKKPESSLVPV